MSVVPITRTVRIGTRMSPSAGIVQRLTTVFTRRWFMAIMIPLPGMISTPSMPAMSAIWPAHAPEALIVKPRLDGHVLARALVVHACARDRAVERRIPVTRW